MTEQELLTALDECKKQNELLKTEYETKLHDQRLANQMILELYKTESSLLNDYATAYIGVLNSNSWKFCKPFRWLGEKSKALFSKSKTMLKLAKGVKLTMRVGPKKALKAACKSIEFGGMRDYSAISDEQRAKEEATQFPKDITFSILVPLYNTPLRFLDDMIESVQAQTYKKWELCLADGSDGEHDEVGRHVKELAAKDPRIVYKKLDKNMGISGNTNACIDMATGNFISLFDHDDILHPSALYETAKAICEHDADLVYTDEATFEGNDITNIITFHHKPDFAIDNLRANNYICHFTSFSKDLLEKSGKFRHEYDGSQDHDMVLRLTENARKVFHVRKLLYFWRSHKASVAADINAKTYAIDAGKKAVHDSIVRTTGRECVVSSSRAFPTIYNIQYELIDTPLVSIIIPNKNHFQDLKRCILSIIAKSTYQNYEILIMENNSNDQELFDFYEKLDQFHKIRIIHYEKPFNYSDINNLGVQHANGKYVLLLNNDIEIISEDWIEQMLMYAQRDDVGAVGAKLLYPDRTIQHAGIIIGMGADRVAGHEHYRIPYENLGYMGRMFYARNTSAVTGACLMIRKSIYEEVGGLDTAFAVAYNDIDFCLKVRQKGYLNVVTPLAELYHFESLSRGSDTSGANHERFLEEIAMFKKRWHDVIEDGDPYFNPNFSLDYSDFRLK